MLLQSTLPLEETGDSCAMIAGSRQCTSADLAGFAPTDGVPWVMPASAVISSTQTSTAVPLTQALEQAARAVWTLLLAALVHRAERSSHCSHADCVTEQQR